MAEIREHACAHCREQDALRLKVSFFHATEAQLKALELMLMNSSANQTPLVFTDAAMREWVVVPSTCRIHRGENREFNSQACSRVARLRFDLTMECIPT